MTLPYCIASCRFVWPLLEENYWTNSDQHGIDVDWQGRKSNLAPWHAAMHDFLNATLWSGRYRWNLLWTATGWSQGPPNAMRRSFGIVAVVAFALRQFRNSWNPPFPIKIISRKRERRRHRALTNANPWRLSTSICVHNVLHFMVLRNIFFMPRPNARLFHFCSPKWPKWPLFV